MMEEGLAWRRQRRFHHVKDALGNSIKYLVRRKIPKSGLRLLFAGTGKRRGIVKKGLRTILREDSGEDSGVREAVSVTRRVC